jgi:ADP-glucose pyrophosphorylase
MPGRLDVAVAPMGLYAFDRGALLGELRARRAEARDLDFGKDVIPAMVRRGARVHAFPFRDTSGRPRYWRDIGTLDSYFAASMDVALARALANFTASPRTPLRDAGASVGLDLEKERRRFAVTDGGVVVVPRGSVVAV